MSSSKIKVFVGMSGGVDSSVSAALLQEAGYEVMGVFIKGWYPEWLPCNWREERQDAMRVAAELGISFQTMDLQEAYKRDVADYMIVEYSRGRTPNPDVMCNKHIKFGAFFNEALKQDADMVATGHYARIRPTTDDSQQITYQLLTGVDREKDQSYFLWALSQDILSRTLFPVGGYTKQEVRRRAETYGLPTARKKDSQGICFLGKVDMREFLKHYVKTEEGRVLNTEEETIGTHDGALLYTLGQRHGFIVTKKRPDEGAHYVVAKDLAANTITVSSEPRQEPFMKKEITLKDTNWIDGAPREGKTYQARFRYRQELQTCTVQETGTNTAYVSLDMPQASIAPGQSLVVYNDEVCLGGGVIE